MTALWTSAALTQALGLAPVGNWAATGVSTDSRTLSTGDVFVALVGDRFDGHDHAGAALAAGAAAVVVNRPIAGVPVDRSVIVADTLVALAEIGKAARARAAVRVAAVTGSVGKTGTKDMLAAMLTAQAPTHASIGNLNNHIGVPLSLARMPASSAFAVFELGMNHPGEIGPLSRLVRPDAGVITWVSAAHLEFFESEDGIALEKATVLDGLEPGGVAILPRDNVHFARLEAAAHERAVARIASFGTDPAADIRLMDLVADVSGSDVAVEFYGQAFRYRIGVPGRHWAMNSMAALAALDALGGDIERARPVLAAMTPPKGRGVRSTIPWGGGTLTLIDESYNASPAAVRAALLTMAAVPATRRVAILGDMKELGADAPSLHAALASDVVAADVQAVFCCGPLMTALKDALPADRPVIHTATAEDLIAHLKDLQAGDLVLVKGSLSMGMAAVVKAVAEGRTG
jgi:UDP-N-acetylmuramoyl-tripeptide--D-alanyl-D-alanine ligase